jgi:predicted dehydrogenase
MRERYPDAELLTDAGALFSAADAHDVVVVAAPNREHEPLGLAAIEAGLHLVVDKPLAASAAGGERLAKAARERGLVASVFHNRRWDGDFLTLRRLVSEAALGDLVRLESRFDRWRPRVQTGRWRELSAPEDAGGMLFDLGPHLIDQALLLLGPARSVFAEVRSVRPGAEVDDDFFLALDHRAGAALASAPSAHGPRT